MLNPLIAWEPGARVRYTGSLTALHGTYRAHPCTCLNCNDPGLGTARFQLVDDSGTPVASCVHARSITAADDHLDRIAAQGGDHLIVLADKNRITVSGPAGTSVFDEVFLHPGLDAPDWDHAEERWELHLAGDPELLEGRLFIDVPVDDVRALIAEHSAA